jgi:hypothetical protein
MQTGDERQSPTSFGKFAFAAEFASNRAVIGYRPYLDVDGPKPGFITSSAGAVRVGPPRRAELQDRLCSIFLFDAGLVIVRRSPPQIGGAVHTPAE